MTEDGFTIRWMSDDDLHLLADLDRSERIHIGYRTVDGSLESMDVDWDVPSFFKEGGGEHSVQEQIEFCLNHLAKGAHMVGAFVDDRLAAVGLLTPEIRPGVAQLSYLQVSKGYRRAGLGSRLIEELTGFAKEIGSNSIYVSATPSESAVGFYQSHGYELVQEPIEELLELEPEDIHLWKRLV